MLEHKVQYLNFCCAVGRCLSTVQRVLTMFFLRFNQFSHHVVDFKGGTHKVLTLCHSLALCRILFQSRNPEIQDPKSRIQFFFENLRNFQKSGNFATRCFRVALFVSQMDPEVYKSKSQKSISFENLKSPHNSGRFDISGPPVPLFVAEISPSDFL